MMLATRVEVHQLPGRSRWRVVADGQDLGELADLALRETGTPLLVLTSGIVVDAGEVTYRTPWCAALEEAARDEEELAAEAFRG